MAKKIPVDEPYVESLVDQLNGETPIAPEIFAAARDFQSKHLLGANDYAVLLMLAIADKRT